MNKPKTPLEGAIHDTEAKENILHPGSPDAPENLVAIVKGGVLQEVYGDRPFNLNVIDVDNLKEEGFTNDEIDERIVEAIKGKSFVV